MSKPIALIYRHQLFKTSEPFIHAQASRMTTYRPVFVGRKTLGSVSDGSEVKTIAGASAWARFSNRLWCEPRPFLEALSDQRAHIMHAHFGLDGLYAIPVARALGIPLVVTFHGFDVTVKRMNMALSGRPTEMRYAVAARRIGEVATKLLCVSNFIRERAVEYGFPESALETHYIGIDAHSFSPARWQNQRKKRILHVARLVEKKGTRFLIEAFAELRKKGFADIQLDIVGDGPLRGRLEQLATSLQLGEHIRFWGAQPWSKVIDLMSDAYAFCLPSITARSGDSEGLGMVLLEAAAKHIPTVATRHGGIPEVIKDGENGLLVDERDVSGLLQALASLLTDSTLHTLLACNARRVVEERFDINKQTRKLEALYTAARGGIAS
ncbi:glycosyltransferase [Paraburkholderia sediminicola]|uniref:glycosyltransferase n=1 Tax=Paraburkholderia sediminicola TaxID=458836 RepID=UPI0038B77613